MCNCAFNNIGIGLIDWLIDWLIDLLIGWLTNSLSDTTRDHEKLDFGNNEQQQNIDGKIDLSIPVSASHQKLNNFNNFFILVTLIKRNSFL